MIQCSACGALIAHSWDGHHDKETGEFTCNGCYNPELHPDPDAEEYDWLLDAGPDEVVLCPWCGAHAYAGDTGRPADYCSHRPVLQQSDAVQ